MIIDLHTHSNASDGELSPAELVKAAHQAGIRVLALTDHDTVAGIPEAIQAASEEGVRLIPGVELSSCWQKMDVHIVGLDVDSACPQFLQRLQEQMQRRLQRAQIMAEKLDRLGCHQSFKAAAANAPRGIPARPHFAQVLVDQGLCQNRKQAFTRYLKVAKPAYVKTEWPEMAQAVHWIHQAGGKAVLAHPGRYPLTRAKLNRLVTAFVEAGGDALEVSVSTHTPDMVRQLADLTHRYGLYASQGSDYHGPSTRWVQLGKMPALPSQCQLLMAESRASAGSSV